MAKELHITIDNTIGSWQEDEKLVVGYMDYMLDGALDANPDVTDLTVSLDCPGGCTYQGAKIYSRLVKFRNTPGNTLTMVNENMAASYGAVLMQAATPGKRKSYITAPFLVHKPLYGQLENVNADDLESLKAELDMVENTLATIFAKSTGRPIEQIKADFKESLFISAQVALEKGYIDEIIEATPKAQPKQREAKAVAWYTPPKTNPNNNVMTEEQQNSFADKIINGIAGFFKAPKAEAEPENPAPVAATETLENGVTIYFEGSLSEGSMVYSDAEMTVLLSNGDHVLTDGRTISVSDGAVTAISEPAPANNANEELIAAQAKIEELEGKLAGIQNSIAEKDKTIKGLQAFNRQKSVPKPAQNFAGDSESKEVSPEVKAFSVLKKK